MATKTTKEGKRSARRSFSKQIRETTPRHSRRRMKQINQRTKRLKEGQRVSGIGGR
jgi:hypothetical protein